MTFVDLPSPAPERCRNADDRSTSIADSARRSAESRKISMLLTSRYSPCVRDELDQPIGAMKIAIAPILI